MQQMVLLVIREEMRDILGERTEIQLQRVYMYACIYIYIWGGGVWVQLLGGGVRGPTLVLLIYMNVAGMRPRSRLSSQPLMIPAPWVFLRVGCSISLVPPWVTASSFLARNREA